MLKRRQFCHAAGSLAFAGLSASLLGCSSGQQPKNTHPGYGPLLKDPNGLLDLPKGFHYTVVSALNDAMNDGLHVPDNADGMGCFGLDAERVALVRNHELKTKHIKSQPSSVQTHQTEHAYDQFANGVALPGGTSTIIYNLTTQQREHEFMSLCGTIRNCSGGVTPWGSWLSCEESVALPNTDIQQAHGYVFEVPSTATTLVDATPLKAMGRFNHEAAAVDPKTGIVYMTEDRADSVFYRFIPKQYGQLAQGGTLQALVIKAQPQYDTRNWEQPNTARQQWLSADWVTLTNTDSPDDDLRQQAYHQGAALFARGEGIHWGDHELYFCCTNGGANKLGQVMRYQPSPFEGTEKESQYPGRIQLFFESEDASLYNFGDNLTVTPQGHLLICEDQYSVIVNNHLRGITPTGEVYSVAHLTAQTEPAGACFSPDGSTLFVNVYSPAKTLAITGPWAAITRK